MKKNIPNHIAIIMDGNGRWAKKRGLARSFGHMEGAKTLRKALEYLTEIGVKYLTVYAFSTENWNRPALEVKALMELLVKFLRKEADELDKNNVRLNMIGNLERFPEKVKNTLVGVIDRLKHNTGTTLTLALSYGAREELLTTIKRIAQQVEQQQLKVDAINEDIIQQHLYTYDLPNVDLLIRTSGEYRISNFLLWQIAYAELYFTDVLWPDFTKKHLEEALISYQNRERRFGKISEQLK